MFDVTQKTSDFISVVLTHECNKKCAFCVDAYRGAKEFMTDDTVSKAIEFGHQNNIKDMLLVGGEPTLHPKVISIAKRIKDNGFRVIMTTNYSRPEIVRSLDGIVDCFNISFYSQPKLPQQADFVSDLTLHTLIHKKQLNSKVKLDEFIESNKGVGHLKFSTLDPCNDWARKMQSVPYLDSLDAEKIVLFNEIEGLLYRGAIIKRHDRIVNHSAQQSFKVHVDGAITQSWQRHLAA